MTKRANKTLIGGFVLGAVALAVVGIVIFGSGHFLTEGPTFVMYFRGSVKGLNVGAPVVFRGVKIGSVKDVVLRFDPANTSVQIPVFVEMDPRRITRVKRRADLLKFAKLLVERGMRAQLQLPSLVTGQSMIELDFHPEKPVKLTGTDTRYPEIPTIPSSMEEFTKTFEKLPLDELAMKLTSAIAGIERAVNAPEIGESLKTVNQTLKDLQKLVQTLDSRMEPIASSIEDTLGAYEKLARDVDSQLKPLATRFEETVRDTQKLVRNLDRRVGPLQSSISSTVEAATTAIKQAKVTLGSIENVTGENSVVTLQLTNTLRELSAAARSIRIWAEYLERHPEALLRGKTGSRGR